MAKDYRGWRHQLCQKCSLPALIHDLGFALVSDRDQVQATVAAEVTVVGPVYINGSVWQKGDRVIVSTACGLGLPVTWHVRLINLSNRQVRHVALCRIKDQRNLRFNPLTNSRLTGDESSDGRDKDE